MAELDTSYRTPRHRPGMDPNTRKLALIAGGIGAALVVMVGAWSLAGGKPAGVPVVQADARPLRVKPEKTQQGPEIDEPTDPDKQALAPTPEAPQPEALRAQAEKAAAEKTAAEKAAAERSAAEKAAEKPATEKAVAAAPPPRRAAPTVATAAAPPARPPAQPVALTAPTAPPPRPAPSAARAGRTQVQLAALTSEQGAHKEWNRLEKRMPEILGGRRPAVVKTEHDGRTYWRLRIGGFADAEQASSFCEKIRAKRGNCAVASF
ncbi:MAG: SPOR domain-containing protein [Acetobacteraceae bacterium]|nr:SPOR domain-containing protein [Acetobacteraceae bacterium]